MKARQYASPKAASQMVLLAAILSITSIADSQASGTKSQPAASRSSKPIAITPSASTNSKTLHRLDFRVMGSSCPVCLKRIERRIFAMSGVVKDAIMLRAPYAGVVVYDASKIAPDTFLEKARVGYPKVSFADKKDSPISQVPLILVPHIGEVAANQ